MFLPQQVEPTAAEKIRETLNAENQFCTGSEMGPKWPQNYGKIRPEMTENARAKMVVECTLRDTSKPLGVAEYRITAALPEWLKGNLPSIEDLEAELRGTSNSEEHGE